MGTICIQLQPDNDPKLDVNQIRAALDVLIADPVLVSNFSMDEGEDNGRYVNFFFDTELPTRLWSEMMALLYGDSKVGPVMNNTSIVTCTGKHGWDDYLLLHHFDPNEPLDKLS